MFWYGTLQHSTLPEASTPIGCLMQDDASPEALAQNALAVALSALLVWGFGSILWKLAVVSYALFAAAFRYSFVALVLLVVVVFFAA